MLKEASVATQSNNFNLKTEAVELVGHRDTPERVFLSIEDLEKMRVEGAAIPASKHGLEVICGASCETGAQ